MSWGRVVDSLHRWLAQSFSTVSSAWSQRNDALPHCLTSEDSSSPFWAPLLCSRPVRVMGCARVRPMPWPIDQIAYTLTRAMQFEVATCPGCFIPPFSTSRQGSHWLEQALSIPSSTALSLASSPTAFEDTSSSPRTEPPLPSPLRSSTMPTTMRPTVGRCTTQASWSTTVSAMCAITSTWVSISHRSWVSWSLSSRISSMCTLTSSPATTLSLARV